MAKKAPPKAKPAEAAGDGLTARRRLFVAAYLANGGNATRAAVTAGYGKAGARTEGARLLANADVQAAIEKGREDVFGDLKVRAEVWKREVEGLAFMSVRRMVALGIPPALKTKSLEMLGKAEGHLQERVKHEGGFTVTLLDPYAKKPEGA